MGSKTEVLWFFIRYILYIRSVLTTDRSTAAASSSDIANLDPSEPVQAVVVQIRYRLANLSANSSGKTQSKTQLAAKRSHSEERDTIAAAASDEANSDSVDNSQQLLGHLDSGRSSMDEIAEWSDCRGYQS